jgi:2-polyprenyl-3-methyl-5-hydroxy-6-metoxy-1,4-benzoquinol methylase
MELIKGKIIDTRDNYHWVKINCPICDVPPKKYLGKRGGHSHRENLGVEAEIWECGKCSLIFPNPLPVPVNGLNQHYSMDAHDYFAHHDLNHKKEAGTNLINKAETILGKKGKILDIGTGRGEIILAAQKEGWEVEGIEPSETFAVYVEKQTGLKIRRETLEKCNFPDEEFDVVILSAVLEHLYNPDEVVGEISRILKPRGIFYFDIPNEKGLYFKIGNLYQKLQGRDWSVNLAPTFSPFHIFGFSPKSVKILLSKHNMKVKDWNVYAGESLVPHTGGIRGIMESQAAKLITSMSKFGNFGTYIEAWAIKE